MFGNKQVEGLNRTIAELRGELGGVQELLTGRMEELGVAQDVAKLRKEKAKLEVEKSQREEEFAKERRELEHMVGLEHKRQEQELLLAVREAEVKVGETNLTQQQDVLQKQLDFIETRFVEEVKYLKDDILKGLLSRLPTVTVDRQIHEGVAPRDED